MWQVNFRPLTKPESDSGSDRTGIFAFGAEQDSVLCGIILSFWEKAVLTMTQVDRTFTFRAARVSNNNNKKILSHASPSTWKSSHWETFCFVTSCDYNSKIWGAFLLFGKTGCSGDKSNGTYFSTGNFSKKKEYLLRYYSFLVFTGMIEKSCSICSVSIVSSSLVN